MKSSKKDLVNSLKLIKQGVDGFKIATLSGYVQFSEAYLLDILNGVRNLLIYEPSLKANVKETDTFIYKDFYGNYFEFTFEIYNDYKEHVFNLNQILEINKVSKLTKECEKEI